MCSFRGLGFSSPLLSAPQTLGFSLWEKLSPEATDEGIRPHLSALPTSSPRGRGTRSELLLTREKLARRSRD